MENRNKDPEILRSVLPPFGCSTNDRYQLVREGGTIGFAFKPMGSGVRYIAGTILCFGVICPAFFIGFWLLTGRTHGGMIGLIGIPTCALGPLLGWVQWKWEIQRQKAGPLWMFAPATGMFSNVRQNAGFHRDRLCAIQFLKFDEEQKFIQINFVVNQPDGQLPKRHVLCTVGDCGWDNSRSLVRDFLREAGGVGVPVLHHQEVCTHDFGYMPVDWIRGKKKRT